MQQGSQEWIDARLGKVTASRVAELMARTKTGFSTSRANYMAELICERLTGSQAEKYSNAAMAWGTEQEPNAKAAYAFMEDVEIADVGFVPHPTISDFGASPDGLVGEIGLVEIKCPITATHLDTLLNGTIDGKYITQMQVQLACTGRAWCDFVSYDPRLPVDMQLWVKRVHRDAGKIAEIETEVTQFLAELTAKIAKLQAMYAEKAA